VDWNDDGLLDIIVGDREGSVSYFRRLAAGPLLLIGEPPVEVAGGPIKLPHNSSPSVTDWNNDGLPDLVVGRSEGIPAGLFLFVNQGTAAEPLFMQMDTVRASGEPIQIYYGYPDFFDMNGDGLQDLIVGSSSGKIGCFLNTGTASVPEFTEEVFLQSGGEDINFYSYVRPSVCDWNEDGCPDLLASDYSGSVYLFLGDPETGIGEAAVEEGNRWTFVQRNPARGSILLGVDLDSAADIQTRIYSLDGRLLMSHSHGALSTGEHVLQVDISSLPAGAVILEIRDVGKFVKLPTEYQLVTINI